VIVLLAAFTIGAMTIPLGHHVTEDRGQSEQPSLFGEHRLVFAHYFPPYPISLDNVDPKNDYYAKVYLDTAGLGGEFAQYGSMLRDRPVPRPSRPEADWRERDLLTEINQAISAGVDGFSVDILTTLESEDWVAGVPSLLLKAAERAEAPFTIMLMPDMHGELGALTPDQLADQLAQLAGSPAAFRLEDGRLVVSPYKAENRSPSWWQQFLTAMKIRHDIDVALLPVFVDGDEATIRGFDPISFGMSTWGGRNPAFNPIRGFSTDAIEQVHGLGKLWMQAVSVQDYRPVHQIFDEPENTTNLRNTWRIAMDGNADWVQLITWNDYSESTAIAPSMRHGTALLDLIAYYIAYFKTGEPPPVTEDRMFLSHRTQLVEAGPYARQTAVAALRQGSVPGRDAVEALTFLTAPGTVTVTVGREETSCDAPAGVSTCIAQLGPLTEPQVEVSAEVRRDQRAIIDMTSPFPVIARPLVQDLSYVVSQSKATHG
jgi:Glycosyl hydrolase family 71